MNIAFQPAYRLAQLIRNRKIGCLELLDLYLARGARHGKAINAIVVHDTERARKRAKAADRALAKGDLWGPLHGVPMTIKESFDVAGLPTTWGVTALQNHTATTDALAVARFRAAGAVLFGKTNVPVMLADWQTFNPIYGTTNNPWDLTRGPGGSSGGSAAALAAGLTGLEAGSDIGASIRDPAHYCGVYGHKPTYGICSTRGQSLPGQVATPDIAVVGPLARSARDLEIALRVMAGPDDIDAIGWKLSLPKARQRSLREFKVGVLPGADTAPVDAVISGAIQDLADFLARNGAKVNDRARPDIDLAEAHRVFIQLLRAATSRGADDKTFAGNVARASRLKPDAPGYEAWMLQGSTMRHREWLHWNERRHQLRLKWAEFFGDYDLLLCPPAATPAFPHNQKGERWERMVSVNGKPQPSTTQMFWAGFSGMAGLPSTVAPAALSPEGLPVGVQIVGPQYGDLTCIALARLLEKEYRGFVAPPGYDD